MKLKKAIIPAAGLGTRFLPATKAQPKEMLPIVDKPSLQFIVEEAVESGIDEILIITARNKKSIEDHFDRSIELELELTKKGKMSQLEEIERISKMADIHYIRQKEPKGLGHAISCARSFVGDEPFAVLLGDDIVHNEEKPCLGQMREVFDLWQAPILGVQKVVDEDVGKYGIIDGERIEEGIYRVNDLVEKPSREEAPSSIAVLGRYILTPEIFPILKDTPPGVGGEIQLTDAIKELACRESVYAYVFAGKRYDVGDKQGFLEATVEFALRREDLCIPFQKYLNIIKKEYED